MFFFLWNFDLFLFLMDLLFSPAVCGPATIFYADVRCPLFVLRCTMQVTHPPLLPRRLPSGAFTNCPFVSYIFADPLSYPDARG